MYCKFTLLLFSHQVMSDSWTIARQTSLSLTTYRNLPSGTIQPSHPRYLPLLLPSVFPSTTVFSSESAVCIRRPNTGASVSASVLPNSIQSWFPLRLTGFISLLSRGLSRVFSITTVYKLWLLYCPALTSIHDSCKFIEWCFLVVFSLSSVCEIIFNFHSNVTLQEYIFSTVTSFPS